ncbi:MAG: Asp-tRNA(Asn)/Glu-tRNA(Gln) amidotransferase subunit GatA [Chlamydiales bacterium]
MLHRYSAVTLHQKFISGEISATEIVKHFLKRIDELDGEVGSFLRIYESKALQQAAQQDERRKRGEPLGKLAGVPVGIKDNIHIKGELTTCGSKFLDNYRAPFESTVVRLLREQDAIFIGKTNLDEFAMGSSTEHSAYQETRNPWDLACTPGGSSGGSAAAVAARFCPIALGSDTGGSIRQPASLCGIVGFKPTYGRVSRYGLVAFGSSFDQIGPLTTNVEDAALAMEILGQSCRKDSTSLSEGSWPFTSQLTHPIKGMRVGVPYSFLEGLSDEMRSHFDRSLEIFKELGCTIQDVDLSILKYGIAAYYILATAEASTNLARFDGIRYGVRSPNATTLDEVYDLSKEEGFGKEVKRRILLGTFVLSSGYQDAYYRKAQKVRALMIRHYQEAFKQCDIVAMPVCPGTAFELGSMKDPLQMYLEDIYSVTANLAGIPAISVPSGFATNDKPVGLQLLGPQKGDVTVFQAAYAFEKERALEEKIPL